MIEDKFKKLEEIYSSFLNSESLIKYKGFENIFRKWLNQMQPNEKEEEFLKNAIKIINDIYNILENSDILEQNKNAEHALNIIFQNSKYNKYEGYIKLLQNEGSKLFNFAELIYLENLYQKIEQKKRKMLPIEIKTIETLDKIIKNKRKSYHHFLHLDR